MERAAVKCVMQMWKATFLHSACDFNLPFLQQLVVLMLFLNTANESYCCVSCHLRWTHSLFHSRRTTYTCFTNSSHCRLSSSLRTDSMDYLSPRLYLL